MNIICTVAGCLLGVIIYLVVGLVTPIQNWGAYSTGILVSLCLIGVSIVGSFPWPLFKRA